MRLAYGRVRARERYDSRDLRASSGCFIMKVVLEVVVVVANS